MASHPHGGLEAIICSGFLLAGMKALGVAV